MKSGCKRVIGLCVVLTAWTTCKGEVKVTVGHNTGDQATPAFKFRNVPSPVRNSASAKARIALVMGEPDPTSAGLLALKDGQAPTEADEPDSNFYFAQNTDGGRVRLDLGSVTEIRQINTYSWHPATRAPQVYNVYGSDGSGDKFNISPKQKIDPASVGWKLIASVDTRPKSGEPGGQYGVSIADSSGVIGKYRYLLFDFHRTEDQDSFGNTFYSEINVISDKSAGQPLQILPPLVFNSVNPPCRIRIDVSGAPELREWAQTKLGPTLAEWYPKISAMLPSDGYTPPAAFVVRIRPGGGVAATSMGADMPVVTGNSTWFARELKREATGAMVHEEVHVIQAYKTRGNPGWLVEGIADYIRWYKYEPQSHGAEIRNPKTARYDAAYRPTANFLNFVTEKYDKDIVKQLDDAMRTGSYKDSLWKQYTGKTAPQLAEEWKQWLASNQQAVN